MTETRDIPGRPGYRVDGEGTNERLERTQQAIWQAIRDSPGYLEVKKPPVRVYFGEADCCVTMMSVFHSNFRSTKELLIGVPADWLETVHAPGLASLNGAVVLEARHWAWDDQETPLDGLEEAWKATVMLLDGHGGVEPKPNYIVRYGGETCRGDTTEHAMEWCMLNIQWRLGL